MGKYFGALYLKRCLMGLRCFVLVGVLFVCFLFSLKEHEYHRR